MAKQTLAGLKPNPRNPRTITDKKATMLRDSLARFGDLSGVVFNRSSGQVVGGHQRIKAFQCLGANDVVLTRTFDTPSHAGTVAEGHVDISGERYAYREVEWNEATEKAANLAANKGAGEWDLAQVAEWVDELTEIDFDLDLTMFDADERDALTPTILCDEHPMPNEEIPDPPKDPKTRIGDIYCLGRHRLICGDCTNEKVVDQLFAGKTADITFTSPPYNAGKAVRSKTSTDNSSRKHKYDNYSDDLEDGDYVALLTNFTNICLRKTMFSFINLQMLGANKVALLAYQTAFADRVKDIFIWNKGHCPPHIVPGTFNTKWEYIFCLSAKHHASRKFPCLWQGQYNNVVETRNNMSNAVAENHRAGYPVELPQWFLEKLDFVNSVYDPFCGTGTTLVCAEAMGKTAFASEIDPSYCDIIVARWEKLTGKQANLVSSGMADEVSDA